MSDFYYKLHRSEHGYMLAACDKSACGKKLKTKKVEFFVNPRFYKDKEGSAEELKKIFTRITSANLIGKKVVKLAEDSGLVTKDSIIKIKGLPHAQVVVMKKQ